MTFALAFAALVATSTNAHATPVETFNSTLANGVYFGTGNVNAGWDVVTGKATDGSTLQIGLEAINRYIGPITPNTNDYTYTPGSPGKNGLASWDFAFSVNTGSDKLSAYSYNIIIADTTSGAAFVFDPTHLPDNAQVGAHACNGCATDLTNNGFQNAENLGFGFLPGFNPNAADDYSITLQALPKDGSVDPSVTINLLPKVAAQTPEPSSLALLGTGIIGLAGVARRKFLSGISS